MTDEPSLPALPPLPRRTSEEGAANNDAVEPQNRSLERNRKRVRGRKLSDLVHTSSDPAVFSSDDDPALDNYIHGQRKKKRFLGSWFSHCPASSDSAIGDEQQRLPKPSRRRYLKRQKDSGVWMGSDSSTDGDSSSVDLFPVVSLAPRLPQLVSPRKAPIISAAEEAAQAKILQCIEDGDENVDISALGLESLSNATIAPLSRLALIPTVAEDVPFEQKDPAIKLFLSTNSLLRVPGALFNIEHLTVLSLRGNRLPELPPAISKLKNLQSLNIAQNELRYLPGELLELMRPGSALRELIILPNPFYRSSHAPGLPWGSAEYETLTFGTTSKTSEVEHEWTGYEAELRGRSYVQFMDSKGAVLSDFALDSSSHAEDQIKHEDFWSLQSPGEGKADSRWQPEDVRTQASRVPTLLESALRVATRAPRNDLLTALMHSYVPEHIPALVNRALQTQETGGQSCSVCERHMIIARSEWLEFREVVLRRTVRNPNGCLVSITISAVRDSNEDLLVPFSRRGCSWACVPKVATAPPKDSDI